MSSDKVAVVTGGASGIGRAMARYFVDQAYGHVVVLDVTAAAGPPLVAELTQHVQPPATTRVQFIQCDVASWAAQAAAFAQVHASCGGRIDVVMANAGISEQGASSLVVAALEAAEDVPSEPHLRTLDVNLTGVIYSVKLAIHYMRKNAAAPGGSIICTASNAGLYPFPTAPIYAASKAAVIGLVRSLQPVLAPVSIQINALAPAVLDTNIAPSKDLFKKMAMTPMSTLVKGVDGILSDPTISGAVAEIHGDKVSFRPHLDFVDADSKKNLDNFWSLRYA